MLGNVLHLALLVQVEEAPAPSLAALRQRLVRRLLIVPHRGLESALRFDVVFLCEKDVFLSTVGVCVLNLVVHFVGKIVLVNLFLRALSF